MKPRIVIVGAAGRMGRRLVALAAASNDFQLCGAVEIAGHDELGSDAGSLAGITPLAIPVTDSWPSEADVVIDFSQPAATEQTLQFCSKVSAALVLGTTGITDQQLAALEQLAASVPVVHASNTSVGMNAIFELVGKVAAMLGEQWDAEIIEYHHRYKKDAPSGSALTLAEKICGATGRSFPDCLVNGRSGQDVQRRPETIGIHAVRAGDITGRHDIVFGAEGETITITHTAQSRDIFARGALRAAKWLSGKNPGLYSMSDCLS